jgi:hypothetical protein
VKRREASHQRDTEAVTGLRAAYSAYEGQERLSESQKSDKTGQKSDNKIRQIAEFGERAGNEDRRKANGKGRLGRILTGLEAEREGFSDRQPDA